MDLVCKKENIPMIFLTRRDIFEHTLSLLISVGGNRGYQRHRDDQKYLAPTKFEATDEQIDESINFILDYSNSLNDIQSEYQLVYYEDIIGKFDESPFKKLPHDKQDILLNYEYFEYYYYEYLRKEVRVIKKNYGEAEEKSKVFFDELVSE